VVLFYSFHLDTPPANERGWWQGGTEAALQEPVETGQGIVVLHHAISAFPGWAFWSEMVGIPHASRAAELQAADPSALSFGETLHLEIADPGHPITSELSTFELYGETWGPLRLIPGPTCHILLTTDHPKMATVAMAWTHEFGTARVFCLQPGHNNDSYADPIFRTVLSRGIQWAAGRL
jgi:type 1 glutamine amidotransferase